MASKKKSPPVSPDPIFDSAASLWEYLTTQAGLDSLFYDKEILLGNDADKGLYEHLGISPKSLDFVEDLQHYKITVEKLLVAFFKTLQPFSQMMSDICVFFESHLVKETNKSLSIRFNFDSINGADLEFSLEHFRQTLSQLTKVKQLVDYFHLNSNQFWMLTRIFGEDYSVNAKNLSARKWIDNYKITDFKSRHYATFNPPDAEIPSTGNESLNQQLSRVIRIWKSFVERCRSVDINRERFREKIPISSLEENYLKIDEIMAPWSARDVRHAESDFWPSTMLDMLFYKLEEMNELPANERSSQQTLLANSIRDFLRQLPQSQVEEEQLLRELIDLLKLPVWQRRSELYAVWILTLMDEIVKDYPRKIHHTNGMLSLSFAATHIATIETQDGDIQLWSEVRSLVEGTDKIPLEGKSRKTHIQPDYTIYKANTTSPTNCILGIEVKQYKKFSNSNFKNALNDYTRGLPNAHVFLVNYGSVSSKMKVTEESRAHFVGQIMPANIATILFKDMVRKFLPSPPLPARIARFDDLSIPTSTIDSLYVDISGSLNEDGYKDFIQAYISALIQERKVNQLLAVDDNVRQKWLSPNAGNVKEMIRLPFNKGTDFVELMLSSESVLVITDMDGLRLVEQSGQGCYVIVYHSKDVQELKLVKGG